MSSISKCDSMREIADEDSEYLEWVASADFSPEVAKLVARALTGDFPEPAKAPQPSQD